MVVVNVVVVVMIVGLMVYVVAVKVATEERDPLILSSLPFPPFPVPPP